jgi:hypothetical protein
VYQIKEEGIKNDIKETQELLRQQDIKNLEERLVRGGIIYWQMTLSEQSMIGRLTWTVSKRVNLHRKSHVRTFIAAEHPSQPQMGLTCEPRQGSLSDRILIAENRCAALFVFQPCDRTLKVGSALQCVRRSGRATVSPLRIHG